MNQGLLLPTSEDSVIGALQEILESPEWDRRAVRRVPYFGPVIVGLKGDRSVNLSAFARDISPSGIGLVHLMPLDKGPVIIQLTMPTGNRVELLTEIRWCRDYGDGWYASGGLFLDVLR